MRAMVLEKPRQPLVPRDVPKPKPRPGQLLVRVATCAVCRTDLHVVDGELPDPKLPLILGHQIAGRIEEIGGGVKGFSVGDSVRVHTRVVEGDKERIQIFAGIVIGRKGRGLNETFTVRRISYGEGVERVFPVHSPRIAKVEVEKKGTARRAKLNYLRGRKGKQATAVRE